MGHELIFIVADDDDWPKDLYARLGFDPIGRAWAFTRPGPEHPAATAAASARARRAARVVGRLAHVAGEGGVGDDPLVPRPRRAGRDG